MAVGIKRRRVGPIVVLALVGGLLTGVALEVATPTATAAAGLKGQSTPVCGGSGSVSDEWHNTATGTTRDPLSYAQASVFVPAGATVNVQSSGVVTANGNGSTNDAITRSLVTPFGDPIHGFYNDGSSGVAGGPGGLWPWSGPIRSWTNNTGGDHLYFLRASPQFTGALGGNGNAGITAVADSWTVTITVTGGSGNDGAYCAELAAAELSSPNPSEENGCGAQPGAADPVNVVQGNFWESWVDAVVPGRGPGLLLGRSYSSANGAIAGPFGYGWSMSYGMSLAVASGVVSVRQENGTLIQFFEDEPGVWRSPPRVNARLTHNGDGTWTLVRAGHTVFTFASDGRLGTISDRSGNTTTLNYAGGLLASVTDASARTLTLTWASGRITRVTAPSVELGDGGAPQVVEVSYGYDTNGNLVTVTDPEAGVWSFGYDVTAPRIGLHQLLTIEEPRHHGTARVVRNHYDGAGRVDWQQDELARQTSFNWATAGQTRVTDPDGHVSVYEHSGGVCTAVVRNPGANESRWQFVVDPATLGRTQVTDPNGNVVRATYNDRGQPRTITQVGLPSDRTTVLTYDADGLLLTSTDPSLTTTTLTYESGSDRIASVTRPITPGGGAWTRTYAYADAANPGRLTSIVDERSKIWRFEYSAFGDQTASVDPMGNRTTVVFNSLGWPLTSVAPNGNAGTPAQYTTSWTYNRRGEVLTVRNPHNEVTAYVRDGSGNVATASDPVLAGLPAETSTINRDHVGRVLGVTRPDGSVVATEYTLNGSVSAQVDPALNRTSYTYDAQGRLVTFRDSLDRVTRYSYDAGGRLVSVQQPGGNCSAVPKSGCVTFGYNQFNERTSVDYSDASTPDVSYGYDVLGRRTAMSDIAGTSTWSWDSIGRLLSYSDPVSGTIGYGFVDSGPVSRTITYPGGQVLTRTLDHAGRIDTTAAWTGGTTLFGYDNDSNLTTINTAASTGAPEDTYSYDRADRLTGLTLRRNGSTIRTLGFPVGADGSTASSTASGMAADAYTYDATDMISGDVAGAYTYNPADDLTGFPGGRTQQFDAGDQVCYQAPTPTGAACGAAPSGSRTFTYDGRGNRLIEDAADGSTRTLTWDQADRLVAADVPVPAVTGQFHPVTPARILDTRTPAGVCRNTSGTAVTCHRFAAGETLQLDVGGLGGVPANADAVLLNITAVGAAAAGFVTAYPVGATKPGVSNLNYPVTDPISNAAITRLGTNGRVAIFAHTAVDVIVDVAGWYSSPAGTVGGELELLTPSRLLDTRDGTGICTPSPCDGIAATSQISVQIGGQAGVPASVQAVVLNLTVTSPAAAGFLTAYTTGATRPATSSLNYTAGQTISGLVPVVPDTSGRISIYSHVGAEVIGDLVGYYTTTAGQGSVFMAAPAPSRVLDTRVPIGVCDGSCSPIPSAGTRVVTIRGQGGVPADAVAVMASVTSVGSTVGGFLTAYPNGTTRPNVSQLTYAPGQTVSNAAILPVGPDGKIAIYAHGATDVIVDVTGWFIEDPSVITTYSYDGDGLRRRRTGPDGTTSTYSWDRTAAVPLLLAEAIDAPGTANDRTVRYVYSPDGRVLADITQVASTHALRWYHHDQIGSTRVLTDATGQAIGDFRYRAYGELAQSAGTAVTPIGWAGEYRDAETGYTYLRARYYDPSTGQFLSRDPLEPITRTPYGYADNNPTNFTDPSGLCGPLCIIILGAAIGGGMAWYGQAGGLALQGCDISDNMDWGEVWGAAALGGLLAGIGVLSDFAAGGGAFAGVAPRAVSAFDDLAHSGSGVRPFTAQQAVTRGQGGQIQAHHLIERRFANVIGGNTDDWASIVVTRAEHQQFTNAWRQAIPYGPNGTGMATRAQVEAAARQVYADYPEILTALGLG